MREPVAASQCRRRFRERLDLIAARYPPRIAVDLDHRADLLSARRRRDHRLQSHQGKESIGATVDAVPRIHPRGFSRHLKDCYWH